MPLSLRCLTENSELAEEYMFVRPGWRRALVASDVGLRASTSACLPFVFELPGLLLCSGFCQLLLNVVDAVQHSSIAWL